LLKLCFCIYLIIHVALVFIGWESFFSWSFGLGVSGWSWEWVSGGLEELFFNRGMRRRWAKRIGG
jgi:hypothetical protein